MTIAARAARAFDGDSVLELIEKAEVDGVNRRNHPVFLQILASIEREMGEAQSLDGEGDKGQSIQNRIDELPALQVSDSKTYGSEPIQKQLRSLYQ